MKPGSATAEFVVPFDVNILLSPGLCIVLNPVPEEPLLPLEPEVPEEPLDPDEPLEPEVPEEPLDPDEPLEPELPEDPLDPDVPEQIPKQVIVIPVSPLTRIGVSVAHTISE